MSDQKPEPGNESKLFGVSIRSWNATLIIVLGMSTICVLAWEEKDAAHVMALVTGAVGYLFGKASGIQQGRQQL